MKTPASQAENKKLSSTSLIPKSRSPNYPSLSLPEAIKRIDMLHKAAYSSVLDSDTVAKAIGFSSSRNGSALKTISSIKKYNLLEETSRGLKVSDLAVDILLEGKGSEKRNFALKLAAFAPSLFAELNDQYGNQLPIDDVIRAGLVKKGFTRDAADVAIKKFRETVEFIKFEIPESELRGELTVRTPAAPPTAYDLKHAAGAVREQEFRMQEAPLLPDASASETLLFRLSRDCSVKMSFDGKVTTKGIEKLIALLDLNKDAYPED